MFHVTGSDASNIELIVGRSGTGALNVSGGAGVNVTQDAALGEYAAATGTVSVTGAGSTWTNGGNLSVGVTGNGTLNVTSGGQVSNMLNGYIGANAGSTSTATVTGSGSMWTNSANLYVGDFGAGTLNVEGGGLVSNRTGVIGENAGFTSTANVAGANSAWTNSDILYVGYAGSGGLHLTGGGHVSNTMGSIGDRNGSISTATVAGAGSAWTNSGNLNVGEFGAGTLNIMTGGNVSNAVAYIGNQSGSTGIVSVDGAGSTWTNSNLYVASVGAGTLNISNGAQVHVSSSSSVISSSVIGYHAGSVGEVTVTGTGSAWLNEGELIVGESGDGTLMITNGGLVRSTFGNIGWTDSTAFSNGNGSVTVDGTNSSWSIVVGAPGSTGRLVIGQTGKGVLKITGGGSVSSVTGYIGFENRSIGDVTVDGAGSTWGITGDFHVGGGDFGGSNGGSGMLHVTNGGRVSSINSFLGYGTTSTGTAIVDGVGSLWTTFSLNIGPVSPASLTVSNGGAVQALNMLVVGALGEVHGDGLITANVQNAGLVSPGNSPGALHITGDYAQSNAGKLQIELAGTTPGSQYDQLLITGGATLNGVLQVSLLDGFAPASGDSFDLLTTTSDITGTFATQQLPILGAGLVWNLGYRANAIVLTVVLPGDYNHNGVVDAADYTVWRDSLGKSGIGLAADGNQNGMIDPGDYDVWKMNFGQSSAGSGTGNSAAVPEPASLLLFLIETLTICWRRWQMGRKLINA